MVSVKKKFQFTPSANDNKCVFIQDDHTRALYAGFTERGWQLAQWLKCRGIVLAYFHIFGTDPFHRTINTHIAKTTNEDQTHFRTVVGSSY